MTYQWMITISAMNALNTVMTLAETAMRVSHRWRRRLARNTRSSLSKRASRMRRKTARLAALSEPDKLAMKSNGMTETKSMKNLGRRTSRDVRRSSCDVRRPADQIASAVRYEEALQPVSRTKISSRR